MNRQERGEEGGKKSSRPSGSGRAATLFPLRGNKGGSSRGSHEGEKKKAASPPAKGRREEYALPSVGEWGKKLPRREEEGETDYIEGRKKKQDIVPSESEKEKDELLSRGREKMRGMAFI